jgi:LPXTG-motif cell wall-anchored protein
MPVTDPAPTCPADKVTALTDSGVVSIDSLTIAPVADPTPTPTPVVVEPALAETGTSPVAPLTFAGLLLALGAGALVVRRRVARR